MTVEPTSIARFAGLLADPSRMSMCLALIDGRAWTSGELARHAGISPSTASEHLTALVSAGVLAEQRQGRHRYLRLAGPEIGRLIEDLATLAGVPVTAPQSLRASRVAAELQFARTCYDHLAGSLGVQLLGSLVDRGYVATTTDTVLTPAGEQWLTSFGLDVDLRRPKRPVVRTCLDWTERRPHLGGLAGSMIREHFLAQGWIIQRPRERAVRVTVDGEAALHTELGLDVRTLRAA